VLLTSAAFVDLDGSESIDEDIFPRKLILIKINLNLFFAYKRKLYFTHTIYSL